MSLVICVTMESADLSISQATTALGVIQLLDICSVSVYLGNQTQGTVPQHCFMVATIKENYLVCAPTQSVLYDWMNAIDLARTMLAPSTLSETQVFVASCCTFVCMLMVDAGADGNVSDHGAERKKHRKRRHVLCDHVGQAKVFNSRGR